MSKDKNSVKVINQHGPTGFFAFLLFVGAFVYFLQGAQDFGDVIVAFFEAIVWPAIAIYHILLMLGA